MLLLSVDMLSLLSQLPQFNRLRMEVQRNPNLLQPLLQEIGATNPELLGVINNVYLQQYNTQPLLLGIQENASIASWLPRESESW